MKKNKIIEIQEEIKIEQSDKDIYLEKGDRIQLLNEKNEDAYVVYVKGPEIKKWMPMGKGEYSNEIY